VLLSLFMCCVRKFASCYMYVRLRNFLCFPIFGGVSDPCIVFSVKISSAAKHQADNKSVVRMQKSLH